IIEKVKIDLKGQFHIELGENGSSGTNGEDAIEHIENLLEVTNLIKVPNISRNQIRVRVFPFSLTGAASKWWEDESISSITTWYKDDWIYEWNDGIPRVNEKPWTGDEECVEPFGNICHKCNPLHFKNGTAKWPNCNFTEDGYCNTRDLPRFIREGDLIRYEDYGWYDTIEDSELKEEALNNKRILEESINEKEESSDDEWGHGSPVDKWKNYEHMTYIETDVSYNRKIYDEVCQIIKDHYEIQETRRKLDRPKLMEDEDHDVDDFGNYLIQKDPPYFVNKEEERSMERRYKLLRVPYVKPPTCKTKKFKVVKYSFKPAEEYVAIKEYEYDIWV
ncbi:hypothetical protein Tco_0834347, partial [Tanacetum coccineum]